MEFEFDKRKSQINLKKHGIDFIEAQDFDKKFDSGENITESLDLSKARRPGQEQKRVNLDFPVWLIHSLDREAKRRRTLSIYY